ncbi:MAG: hypothetical protein Q9159_006787 [Coniocarpon cinnabarinum]
MPAFHHGDHAPVHSSNPVAHYSGDGYKDAIYEDFGQYGLSCPDYTGPPPPPPNHPAADHANHFDRYGPTTLPSIYNQAAPYPPDDYYPDHPCLHPMGAPMIPPLRIDERYASTQQELPLIQGYATVPDPSYPKEEKSVGGVSSKLDYDMDQMTDFVSETVATLYELSVSPVCLADIDIFGSVSAGHPVSRDFRQWILQVLNATRLPSATIFQSMSYLAIRIRQQGETGTFQPTDRSIYKMVTTALILGSKFLDDNTFQNKSWAEVSNLPVLEINTDEREWLAAFGHRLHHEPSCVDGFEAAQDRWKRFQAQAKANHRLSTLQPIDTNLKRNQSLQALSSSSSYPSPYHGKTPSSTYSFDSSYSDRSCGPPSYSQYEAQYGYRSMERSPLSSASHSGPQTPEYLQNGSSCGWGPFNGFSSHASHYAHHAVTPAYNPQYPTSVANYHLPAPRRQCAWTTHGALCQCQSCRYQTPMHSRFGKAVMA